jgi:hypothetical protein
MVHPLRLNFCKKCFMYVDFFLSFTNQISTFFLLLLINLFKLFHYNFIFHFDLLKFMKIGRSEKKKNIHNRHHAKLTPLIRAPPNVLLYLLRFCNLKHCLLPSIIKSIPFSSKCTIIDNSFV